MKQEKLLTISEASELLGVAKSTLRRWEEEGKLIPDIRTKEGQKRYKLSSLLSEMKHKRWKVQIKKDILDNIPKKQDKR